MVVGSNLLQANFLQLLQKKLFSGEIPPYVHMYQYISVQDCLMYIYIYIKSCIWKDENYFYLIKWWVYICIYVYYVYIIYACIYVCMYVCMYECMNVCMYVCIYVCICMHLKRWEIFLFNIFVHAFNKKCINTLKTLIENNDLKYFGVQLSFVNCAMNLFLYILFCKS